MQLFLELITFKLLLLVALGRNLEYCRSKAKNPIKTKGFLSLFLPIESKYEQL